MHQFPELMPLLLQNSQEPQEATLATRGQGEDHLLPFLLLMSQRGLHRAPNCASKCT